MGLLSLTKDGVSFLLDENDITRVYSLDGVVKVEYLKANGGTLDTITVEESLATIDAASDELIELTSNGVAFLLNYTIIRQVLTEGSGSKVIYEKLQTQSVVVEETPTEINALINAPSTEPLRYKALISMSYESYTSGVLIIGKTYIISILEVGDDFSNVGFVSEKTPFVATNTTPTNWGNGTEVINGDASTYAIEGIHVDTLLPTVYNGFIGDTYCCIIEKTGVFVYNTTYTSVFTRQDDDILYFELFNGGLKQVEIEVYP